MHILLPRSFKIVIAGQATPKPVVQAIAQNAYQAFSELRTQA
jgi:hypothetical protein